MPTPEMQAVIDASGFKKGWKYIDGPETGVGTEFYLTHKDVGTYYVCVDQGEVTSCQPCE